MRGGFTLWLCNAEGEGGGGDERSGDSGLDEPEWKWRKQSLCGGEESERGRTTSFRRVEVRNVKLRRVSVNTSPRL